MADRKRIRAVTSVDVARAAGVSQSVVSRAFSQAPGVSPATRERIEQAAAELGYRHNQLARGLITRRSNLLALVAGVLSNPLHLSLIQTLSRLAQARGYRVLLATAPDGHDMDAAIGDVLAYMPVGIVAMAGTPSAAQVGECARLKLPLILVGRDPGASLVSSVCCDNEAAARQVAFCLLAAGHRRFAFLSSRVADTAFSMARERGFCATVVSAGCPAPIVVNGGSSYAGGYAAADALLNVGSLPDAVFCAGDAIAFGFMDAVRRDLGLSIPDRISVVGFDDMPMASWASYELTSVRQQVEAMADAVIDLLLSTDVPDLGRPTKRLVPGDLIIRRSARLAPPGAVGV
ncbi:LacI family DNA-binding transcriptional regulator [Falsiroseomonas sp. E2-1-a4]|uniref:LacI family DNA-binding transcriptional regulator n=1 Tax=Falsiroseomonas sp. E2-1-a4 TaxID=3239299 RepID=UPI003F405272